MRCMVCGREMDGMHCEARQVCVDCCEAGRCPDASWCAGRSKGVLEADG